MGVSPGLLVAEVGDKGEAQTGSPRPSGWDSSGCHSRHVLAHSVKMTAPETVPKYSAHEERMRTWVSTGQDNITRWDWPLGCLQLILDGSGA